MFGRSKRQPVPKFVVFLAIGLLMCLILATISYQSWASKEILEDGGPASYSAAEVNAEIKLPPSASNVYVRDRTFVDVDAWVKFTMDPSDLTNFLANTLCTQELTSITPSQVRQEPSDPKWWDLSQATTLKTCSGSRDDFSHQIWVDMTDSTIYTVYVRAGSH